MPIFQKGFILISTLYLIFGVNEVLKRVEIHSFLALEMKANKLQRL